MFKKIAVKVFQESEQDANTFRSSELSKEFDYKVLIICVTTALSLTVIEYWSSYNSSVFFVQHYVNVKCSLNLNNLFNKGQYAQLFRLTHWVFVLSICYLLIPIFIIKVIFKDSLKRYGLSFQNAFKDYKIYLFMIAFMIPIVFVISYTSSFQAKYPFYKLHNNEPINIKFIIWELEYFFHLKIFLVHL